MDGVGEERFWGWLQLFSAAFYWQFKLSLDAWFNMHLSPWAAITESHKLGGLNHRNLFLTVLEAGVQARSSCQGRFLMRFLFPACRLPLSRDVLIWLFSAWTERVSSGVPSSFYKDISPIGLGLFLWTYLTLIISLEVFSPNTSTVELELYHMNFEGNTHKSIN